MTVFGGALWVRLYKIGNQLWRLETVSAARKINTKRQRREREIFMKNGARRARRSQFEWQDGSMRSSKV